MSKMEGTGNTVTQILNVQVKKTMSNMGFLEIGRNAKFYDPKEINSFPVKNEDLNVWRGYKTSVYLCPKAAYLLVDFSSRVLRMETALDFLFSN